MPGFGHPVHRPVDPRAERILELADERGVSGPHVALARALRDAVAEVWGKPLTMNVSHADRGRAARPRLLRRRREGRADPRAHRRACSRTSPRSGSSRSASLLARGGGGTPVELRVMLEPEVETRPWDEQLALDDASYRAQLAYLLERSAFYREKLGRARPRRGRPRRHRASCR